ncbi:MAG: primosomal protein N' [Candidatus Rokubacteria bacterium]|nr:primosomal protein N' [Candidatus Rokubacteria bacterium]MBI3824639.1 primosomal protein N' [Candidatus Rokubacteria bacterium]
MPLIADVVFDAPVAHPFSYVVPQDWRLATGQRVIAPLKGAARAGVVVALRDGDGARLKPLARLLDRVPLLDATARALVEWIAADTLSGLGATYLALLPPPVPSDAVPAVATRATADAVTPRLLVGAGRETRLLERVGDAPAALVLAPDIDGAARWAQRLARFGGVVRLDSGVSDGDRAGGWAAVASGASRLAVGTRSALLAPLPPGGMIAVVDEQEAAHKPPGRPRVHARDVTLERAAREGLAALFTAATPSAELWQRTVDGRARLDQPPRGAWPATTLADPRGIARREALTPPLARAVRETLAAGRRVFLAVSRLHAVLGCDECGHVVRCARCAIALAYAPAARTLACRLCDQAEALPSTCPQCTGRRLGPFGWSAERVEQGVRRRFPRTRIARYDPEAARGRRADTQRADAAAADIVIGTRGALRLFGPGSLGLAAFVSPDQLLGMPDFRAAERGFALMWAAAERVRGDGALVVQSRNPTHYAIEAVTKQDLDGFYARELRFRSELGYPPFRRLAVLGVTARAGADGRAGAAALAEALRADHALTVYPPAAGRRRRGWHVVVKGDDDLPRRLGPALAEYGASLAARGIMVEAEVDPVEWLS